MEWSGFGIRAEGGGGGGRVGGTAGVGISVHNKWQFSVWSGWLPSTGPLDCRGLFEGSVGRGGGVR